MHSSPHGRNHVLACACAQLQVGSADDQPQLPASKPELAEADRAKLQLPTTAKTESTELDHAAGGTFLNEQDSFYTASETAPDEDCTHSGSDAGRSDDGRSDASEMLDSRSNHEEDAGDDDVRSWDGMCQEAFLWDRRSSLMVCVDGQRRIWYQANVKMCRGNQYLLSWPGQPHSLT